MPTLGSLATGLRTVMNSRRSEVYMIELDRDDRPLSATSRGDAGTGVVPGGGAPSDTRRKFQYYPDSITDTKQVNYSTKEVPGGSLPLYQWVNSGERTISFTAVFTTDVDHYAFRSLDTFLTASGGEFELAAKAQAAAERLRAVGVNERNAYIPGALAWLRRFMLPRYGEQSEVGVPFTEPPRKLYLVFPGTNIHWSGGDGGFSANSALLCIMTQCDVTYEALFPSGNPRIVTVQLSFAEVPQKGGSVRFPRVGSLDTISDALYTYQPSDRTSF